MEKEVNWKWTEEPLERGQYSVLLILPSIILHAQLLWWKVKYEKWKSQIASIVCLICLSLEEQFYGQLFCPPYALTIANTSMDECIFKFPSSKRRDEGRHFFLFPSWRLKSAFFFFFFFFFSSDERANECGFIFMWTRANMRQSFLGPWDLPFWRRENLWSTFQMRERERERERENERELIWAFVLSLPCSLQCSS